MTASQQSKEIKEEFNTMKIKEVLAILLASKDGMTAVSVGEMISVKDTRMVRVFLREAIRLAEKNGHETKRERVPGQTSKIYQVIKVGTEADAKSPVDSQVSGNDVSKVKPAAAASKPLTPKK